MIILRLKFKDATWNSQRANLAIELSHWCKEHNLVPDKDYDWAFMTGLKEVHFRFYGDNPEFASWFALRWGEYL
jgi:hypothetical protein